MDTTTQLILEVVGGLLVLVFIIIPLLVTRFLTTVPAGNIRIVTWFRGTTKVYKGPSKAIEVPLFTTSTTIPSKAINIDLEISDQTADIDITGKPRPIKVTVLAGAIVSVGDSNELVHTAANRFFAKSPGEQTSMLTDLLTSTGRRAINLLHHDELFNTRVAPTPAPGVPGLPGTPGMPGAPGVPLNPGAAVMPSGFQTLAPADDEDRLAIIIKSACSRELQDLGLVFNSLNIKAVQSEVADARRRQSAAEAKANADIVQADQNRRAQEATLAAEQSVNDKQRDLDQRRAENAAIVAQAEAKKQDALQQQREAELKATQIVQASADAMKLKISAEASAEAEAIRLRKVAEAQADAIRQVNTAIADGGNAYFALRQLEMVPIVAPQIANALAQAKMINIASDGNGAASDATHQITSVIQTVLAAQMVNQSIRFDGAPPAQQAGPALPDGGAGDQTKPASTRPAPQTPGSVSTPRVTPSVSYPSAPPPAPGATH
jgi:flotillin